MKKTIFSPASLRPYSESEIEAVGKTLKTGHLSVVFGRQTILFESEFAKAIGVNTAVATSSGSSSLEMALHILGIGYGDEVIIPAYTFGGVVLAVMRNMAIVQFADIDKYSWNISADTIKEKITDKTRAIIVPHMFGNPAAIKEIVALAQKHNIFVIEDCAQAAGAEVNKKQVGSYGDIGCFSFNEIKNLTTGEGGMLVSNRDDVGQRARLLRLHAAKNGLMMDLGYKCTMTEMEAALGRKQLSNLQSMNNTRIEASRYLVERFAELPGVMSQQTSPNATHVYSRFVLRVDKALSNIDRDTFVQELKQRGFGVDLVYAVPLYKHPLIRDLSAGTPQPGLATSYQRIYQDTASFAQYAEMALPEVEKFCEEQFGFIVPADISKKDAESFIEAMQDILNTYNQVGIEHVVV